MEKHLQIAAVLNIINGFIALFGGGIAFMILPFSGLASGETTAILATGLAAVIVISICLVFGLPSVIGGFGLWHRKRWARIVLIIMAILNLPGIPIGTALGIYTLWVLFNSETEKLLTA